MNWLLLLNWLILVEKGNGVIISIWSVVMDVISFVFPWWWIIVHLQIKLPCCIVLNWKYSYWKHYGIFCQHDNGNSIDCILIYLYRKVHLMQQQHRLVEPQQEKLLPTNQVADKIVDLAAFKPIGYKVLLLYYCLF